MLVFEERGKPEYPEKNLSDSKNSLDADQGALLPERVAGACCGSSLGNLPV